MTGIYESMWRNGLVRPQDGRVLAGVCAGLARRFGIGAWPMRWLFLVILIVLPGSPLLIYPLLWIFMPGEDWVARMHGPSAYVTGYPGEQQQYGPQQYGHDGAPQYGAPQDGQQPYPQPGTAQPPASQDPADGTR